jgi:hypothetical protein
MYVRLAFATAIHVEPEILVVDEALAVGDAVFANRCVRKFEELRRRKTTVLLVSHDMGLVKRLCDRAMLLVDGRVAAEGEPQHVVNRYVGMVLEREQAGDGRRESIRASHRHGDGASEIVALELRNTRGEACRSVCGGETVTVLVRSRFHRPKDDSMVGMLIRDRIGMEVYGTNTRIEGIELGRLAPGDELEVRFCFDCWLTPQEYTLTVATQNADGTSQDWLDDALRFEVVDARAAAGVVNLRSRVEWHVSR